jgi:uncharacterized membrane protein YhaH (DUF805 family)
MNRKQFWLRYFGAFGLIVAIVFAIDVTAGPAAVNSGAIGWVLWLPLQTYLVYRRARDVGYPKPGWTTAMIFIPVVGLFVFLTVGFQPTGMRRLELSGLRA